MIIEELSDSFTAARTGNRLNVTTTIYSELMAYSPVWGAPYYIAETIIDRGDPHQDAWVIVNIIRWPTILGAVDGHRAIVKRGRQPRKRPWKAPPRLPQTWGPYPLLQRQLDALETHEAGPEGPASEVNPKSPPPANQETQGHHSTHERKEPCGHRPV